MSGHIVGLIEDPYEITDRDTGSIERGISRRLWLSPDSNRPPQEIKFRQSPEHEQMFNRLVELGYLGQVEVVARVSEYQGRASLTISAVLS